MSRSPWGLSQTAFTVIEQHLDGRENSSVIAVVPEILCDHCDR
ncbi:hypothetical protein [Romeriopsis navalis]|nr:hypothetical protein [Romeriopsis navalis]